jgi:WD40 repeat protein
MNNKNFFEIAISFMIISLSLIMVSGCRSGNEIITEAKNLCEESEGLVHEEPPTTEGEESTIGLQPNAPAFALKKVTYKKFSRWGVMSLLPDFLRSRTDANTIVCINQNRQYAGKYESGAEAYEINWAVQLIGFPDGNIFASKTFYSDYDPPEYTSGVSDIYGDPPDEELVSDWILSLLKGKSAIVSDGGVRDFALSPEGDRLVIADGASLQIWDIATETLIHRIDEVDSGKITFSPNGKLLAGGSEYVVRLFDANNYQELPISSESDTVFVTLDFSPDSRLLATGERNGIVKIWDIDTLQIIQSFQENEGRWQKYFTVKFLPDGNTLVGGGDDGCLRAWDVVSGKSIDSAEYCSRWSEIRDLAISPDGNFLASGLDEGDVLIFDTSTWKLIENLSNRALDPKAIRSITFLPGGSILVGNMQDDIQFWDVETFKKLGKFEMSMEKIVAFPDGKFVALTSGRNTVRILNIEEFISK